MALRIWVRARNVFQKTWGRRPTMSPLSARYRMRPSRLRGWGVIPEIVPGFQSEVR